MSVSPSPTSPPVSSRLLRNALEGAAAAVCAVVAMAAVAAIALVVFDPQSVDSLWALIMAVTALAVGGSVNIGPDTMPAPPAAAAQGAGVPGGGSATLSLSGAVDVVPLAVTLLGAVVLWLTFSWGLRQRTLNGKELMARALGATGAAVLGLMLAASLAHGSFKLPAVSQSGVGALGGKLGELVEKLFGASALGASGGAAQPAMSYDVAIGTTAVGALVWAVAVIAVGLLISRRVPAGFTAGGLRPAWGPSLSALVRPLLGIAALMTVTGAVAVGDHKAAGGAMLLAPVALVTALSVGLGSTWTSSSHQMQSAAGAAAPGAGTSGGQRAAAAPPNHTQHIGDLTMGGVPVWVVTLVVTALLLLACAFAAARGTDPAQARPLHPYRGPLARQIGLAERFGIVTAIVFGVLAVGVQTSFHTSVSMAGHAVGGSEIKVVGGVLWTFVAGLLAGAVAGFAGGLLQGEGEKTRALRSRRSPVAVGASPVPSGTAEPGA
ncbi:MULTISPECIES: streptophobe family protein [Streptomyces]|uniref:streptophobe family protein n=1 Tax=Streptomyces TaxID=1883 RepID=UPI0036F05026